MFNNKIVITKGLIIFLAVLAVIVVGYYSFTKPKPTAGPKLNTQSVLPSSQPTTTSFTYPVSPDSPDVRAVLMVYDFYGRVVKVEQLGPNTKYTLDNSSADTPAFITGNYTQFVKGSNDASITPQPAGINDVKVDSYVDFSMAYNPKINNWQLRAVTIQQSPTSSPK